MKTLAKKKLEELDERYFKNTPQGSRYLFADDNGVALEDFFSQTIDQATKAERERNMNIVLQWQGEVEGFHYEEGMKLGAVGTCLELRKRMK